ncbi:TPA: hypothetical protein OO086_002493 [Legionella pneumophila]|nr:hypothetical protein [Legionella pneumophila]
MSTNSKPLIIALGASLSVAANALASSPSTLFQAEKLAHGYQNAPNTMKLASSSTDQTSPSTSDADDTEGKTPQGKCGTGKCSSDKKGMGKCGTGKCGANQKNDGDDSTNKVKPTDSGKDNE